MHPLAPPSDEVRRLEDAAGGLLRGETPREGMAVGTVLQWLAQTRPLLFHGSRRGDLDVLEPIRLSTDATEFGNQQAVFATSDPVWAIYFATLERGSGFHSTRNGSLGVPGRPYPRWYFFSHNREAIREGRFGDGWVYVVPRDSFRAERIGLFDAAHWASIDPIMPVARVPVSAADFPFAASIGTHRDSDRMLSTLLRAAAGRR